jgi:hypothetical protein
MGATGVTAPSPSPGGLARAIPVAVVLAAAAIALAAVGRLPLLLGASVAVVAVALSEFLRLSARLRTQDLAPVPVLATLGVLAAAAPIGPVPEVLAGAAGVVVLAWIADDPTRPPRGVLRGAVGWGLPGLAVGLAWASSFLLPGSAAPVGVAGGLLAAAVIALAYLFLRPELADAGPASTI